MLGRIKGLRHTNNPNEITESILKHKKLVDGGGGGLRGFVKISTKFGYFIKLKVSTFCTKMATS